MGLRGGPQQLAEATATATCSAAAAAAAAAAAPPRPAPLIADSILSGAQAEYTRLPIGIVCWKRLNPHI